MKYEPLNKIYYKDQENFEKIYQSRLNGDYSITLDFSIHDMPAFFVQTPADYKSDESLVFKPFFRYCVVTA